MKRYDMDKTQRIADFVGGRTGIPRDMFLAEFPGTDARILSLLTSMGHLERVRRGNPNGTAVLLAYHESKRAERKEARIAKLQAKLDALKGEP